MRLTLNRLIQACVVAVIIVICLYSPLSGSARNDVELHRSQSAHRRGKIKTAFLHGYRAYKTYAFPHDSLKPLSKTYRDDRSGWGLTAVDALTGAILLEIPDVVHETLDHVNSIDFDVVEGGKYAVFGTTIRYLGALLSAYDLLTTTHKRLVSDLPPAKIQTLLSQAERLGMRLAPAFSTPYGINHHTLFPNGSFENPHNDHTDITSISGLVLEFTHLSSLTGNSTYGTLAQKSMLNLLNPKPDPVSSYPGLLPKHVNITTGVFETEDLGGWSHSGGGFYEMLMKNYVYDPTGFSDYRDTWIHAADSTIKNLASHPLQRPDLTFLADFQGDKLIYRADASGMFAPANFILGGAVTGEKRFVDFGLRLLKSYVSLYEATTSGLAPDVISWIPATCTSDDVDTKPECRVPEEYATQEESGFVKKHGFWATDSRYLLRPEVLESLYYAYRITGDRKYQRISFDLATKIIHACWVESGFAELKDVNVALNQTLTEGKNDWMSSYMLSEVLMYAYIVHVEVGELMLEDGQIMKMADDGEQDDQSWHVGRKRMEWVFSTQGHPLRVKASVKS
ncbi:glycoside hydrolase family 47 protein [Patellaria atrata CBS 101060]|uniref:alpha-1,2-Mannosidase n=1 Tax=Patellaria atrata CBS 101060 TaxID=1346257 RepID=A0A9P4VN19_9PEZI|nr:glycoside hydrolase family 47 protein [Patellaria atrata CBS 101060]